jgi:hypothetical protein
MSHGAQHSTESYHHWPDTALGLVQSWVDVYCMCLCCGPQLLTRECEAMTYVLTKSSHPYAASKHLSHPSRQQESCKQLDKSSSPAQRLTGNAMATAAPTCVDRPDQRAVKASIHRPSSDPAGQGAQ